MEYVINCRLYKHNIYITLNVYFKFNTFLSQLANKIF